MSADFLTLTGLILIPCFIGFYWGYAERVADQFLEEVMRG
jgi:hypothetical protein